MTLRKRSRELELVQLLAVGDEMCDWMVEMASLTYKIVWREIDDMDTLKKLAADWREATKHYSRSDGHKLGE